MTSWLVCSSISWMRSTVKFAFSASSSTSSVGISPSCARARQTASSTFSQARYFASSVQTAPISGRVYRSITLPLPMHSAYSVAAAVPSSSAVLIQPHVFLSLQPLRQFGVRAGEDLGGQHAGVGGAVDGYRCDRHARGHLDGGEQRVEAAQGAGGHGDTYYRQVRPRCDGASKVGGHPRGADYYFQAALAGRTCVLGDALGVTVGRADLELVFDAVVFEAGRAFFEDGEVGLAPDQDSYTRAQRSSSSIASRAMSV